MKNQFLVFILILSLVVPFVAPVLVNASPFLSDSESVSDDDVEGGGSGHSRSNSYTGLLGQVNEFLIQNGYVLKSPEDAINDFLSNYGIVTNDSSDSAETQTNNYFSNNENFDYDSFLTALNNYMLEYSENNKPYYVYNALPVSQFNNFFNFSNDNNPYQVARNSNIIIEFVNSQDSLCFYTCGANFFRGYGVVGSVSFNVLEEYSFYLDSGSFSVFPDLPYQSNIRGSAWSDSFSLNGQLKLSSGYIPYPDSFYGISHTGASYGTWNMDIHDIGNSVYCGCVNDSSAGDWSNFAGTIFLVPDSVGGFSFPVFKNSDYIFDFYSGNSNIYTFDTDFDLSEFEGIDYDELYNTISEGVKNGQGNLIDVINDVANDYLSKQIEILHDINNALNDSFGNSWLRKIYNLLYSRLPSNLSDKFDDIVDAINNISISGGSGPSGSSGSSSIDYSDDISDIKDLLTSIDTVQKLQLANDIIQGIRNGEEEPDLSDLTTVLTSRVPFCLITDIGSIVTLLSAEPIQPHLEMGIPLSDETFELDLSLFEGIKVYWYAFCKLGFLVLLLFLSLKVYSSLKE